MPYPYNNPYNYPYNNSYSGYQSQQSYTMQAPQVPQIQNGGFISVRGENEARSYPVAPGNSVTFKDETAPYVYTKTMGFSQLDQPIFERYKLIKEDNPENVRAAATDQVIDNAIQKKLEEQIEQLWKEVNFLKEGKRQYQKKESKQ